MVSVMDCGPTHTPHQQIEQHQHQEQERQQHEPNVVECRSSPPKSAVSQRSVDLHISHKKNDAASLAATATLTRKQLKLDLHNDKAKSKSFDHTSSIKSPKSPMTSTGYRQSSLPHQTSFTSQVDLVEDRKTLRDALYQGIFHRHRRTIFALGSFLRMLKSRSSQYNTIRSSSEGEDVDEAR